MISKREKKNILRRIRYAILHAGPLLRLAWGEFRWVNFVGHWYREPKPEEVK